MSPQSLTIEVTGKVIWADHYAAVGTGSSIAAAFLHQRDYSDVMNIDECLYKVLEAKTAAEKNPYVGKTTIIEIQTAQESYFVHDSYIEFLSNLIRHRREEIPDLKFDRKYVELDPFVNALKTGE